MSQQTNRDTPGTCAGCGIRLQFERQDQVGYVPPSAVKRDRMICQRCFRIKNYNEASPVSVGADDFLKVLHEVANTRSLIVHIVDLFDFEGSLISGLQRFVGSNPILLVVNKVDLLPKSIRRSRLLHWVRRQTGELGLKVVSAVLCSARNGYGLDRLAAELEQHRDGKDVYVVGAANVGKSSLINRMIRDFSEMDGELTTSRYPGTTLDAVKIPLEDGRFIIDTPGILYPFRMSEIVSKSDLQVILPEKEIKPVVFQLNEKQTLFFGALARFDFVQGEHQPFVCCFSGSLKIHRTPLDRADELYDKHRGRMLSPPSEEGLKLLPPWTAHSIRVPAGESVDILISGLGWIKASGRVAARLAIHAPKGVKVAVRPSIL